MQSGPIPGALDSLAGQPPRRRLVHFVIAIVMTAIVIFGFWPSYFGPLLRGVAALPLVLHVHGAIFTGWMVLLLTQVALVATGRTSAHRKLGRFGILYGVAVFVMGLVVSFASPMLHLKAGDMDLKQVAGFMIVPLGDMALFGGFFGAAIWYRRKPETHKRLILLATQALLFAAFGRMTFIPPLLGVVVWLTPLLLAVAYEGVTQRRVHRVYVIGLIVLFAGSFRALLAETEGWQRIGRALLRPLL